MPLYFEAAEAGERVLGWRPDDLDYANPNVGEDDCAGGVTRGAYLTLPHSSWFFYLAPTNGINLPGTNAPLKFSSVGATNALSASATTAPRRYQVGGRAGFVAVSLACLSMRQFTVRSGKSPCWTAVPSGIRLMMVEWPSTSHLTSVDFAALSSPFSFRTTLKVCGETMAD